MAIIGFSGSPIKGGNTDRLVQALLAQSGREQQFVNLSSLDFAACRGCAHLCAKTNICPLEDDLRPWMEPILEAEALIFASPVHAGTVTAWFFSFLSRIWCFHHVKNLLVGRPLLLVMTALFPQSQHGALHRFEDDIRRWGHGFHELGTLFHATYIPPCFKCGVGTQCKVGGLWGLVGQDEEKLHAFDVTPDKFTRWEDCPETVEKVTHYAQVLRQVAGQ